MYFCSFAYFFLQMVKLGYSDMRKAMEELMGISSKEGDEPFIELFSDCTSLSCIQVFLSMTFAPQMLAAWAQGRKEK